MATRGAPGPPRPAVAADRPRAAGGRRGDPALPTRRSGRTATRWVVLALAGGVILWVTRHGRLEQRPRRAGPTRRRSPPRTRAACGGSSRGLLIAIGTLVALVLVAAAIFAAVFHVQLGHGIGDRSYFVASASELRQTYDLGIGNLTVDMRELELPVGETHVKARVDIGDLDDRRPARGRRPGARRRSGRPRRDARPGRGRPRRRPHRLVSTGHACSSLDAPSGRGGCTIDARRTMTRDAAAAVRQQR